MFRLRGAAFRLRGELWTYGQRFALSTSKVRVGGVRAAGRPGLRIPLRQHRALRQRRARARPPHLRTGHTLTSGRAGVPMTSPTFIGSESLGIEPRPRTRGRAWPPFPRRRRPSPYLTGGCTETTARPAPAGASRAASSSHRRTDRHPPPTRATDQGHRPGIRLPPLPTSAAFVSDGARRRPALASRGSSAAHLRDHLLGLACCAQLPCKR